MKEGDNVIDKRNPELVWNVDEIGEDYFLLSTDHLTMTADMECIADFEVIESSENQHEKQQILCPYCREEFKLNKKTNLKCDGPGRQTDCLMWDCEHWRGRKS